MRHLHQVLQAIVILTAVGLSASLQAATVNLDFLGGSATISADSRYQDGESMIVSTSGGGMTATLSATSYGEDPMSSERWGLVDASRPWNRGKAGALLRQGFAPSAVGSTQHNYSTAPGVTNSTEASYVSIIIQKPSATLFTQLRVDLLASDIALSGNAWGGTSADGFSSTAVPSRLGNSPAGRNLAWDFSNLNYAGDSPLEIRLYGLVGGDVGTLSKFRVSFTSVPIPEPATLSLLISCAVILIARRPTFRENTSSLGIARDGLPAKG